MTIQEVFLFDPMSVRVCVCVRRVYKNKVMSQLGQWNGQWDCGTDKEKLQVALFSTKLFTEETLFYIFSPNEGTRKLVVHGIAAF